MEHPTKKNIVDLVEYIKGLNVDKLIKTKDKQHDLVIFTFEAEDVIPDENTKQLILDDAYLSWLLFLKFDLDRTLGKEVDYKRFLDNLKCLKKLWYNAVAHEYFERTGKQRFIITPEDIKRDFSSELFKPQQQIPENSTVLSSLVIAQDYKHVLNTLAKYDL